MRRVNREQLRRAFLAEHRWDDAQVVALQPDASFRRYLRLRKHDATAMLMDAPPPREDVDAFVAVTRHLENLGVRAPAIYGVDGAHGFLLLEDLGDQTFARLLADGHDESALYRHAVEVLTRIHQHAEAAVLALPVYDAGLALSESVLLLDWYLPARHKRPLEAAARAAFAQIWVDIFGALAPLAPTLVLRDYHIDNLMLVGEQCAALDYQDAVIGSPAYDLVSLLEDARRDIAPSLADDMLQLYLTQNPSVDSRSLRQHCIAWGAQRHCKVAGIFVRLWLRDGKDGYLQHLPRVMKLLQRHLHEPALEPLRLWLDSHLGELDHCPFTAPAAQLLRHCDST